MLRKIIGPKREEVTGEWRRLRNEEHYGLHSSTHSIRMIKARRVRWAGHTAFTGGEVGCIQGFGRETSEKETTWKTQA